MRRQKGMTLVEVLVALSVFALAGIAVLQTTARQASSLSRLEEKTFAGWVAENQQVQLRLEQRWPEASWVRGETQFAGQRWHWRWQGVETGDPQTKALDVEVRRNKDAFAADASLRTYVVKQ
ncbi:MULTISPECIES: type II secretion system minor pseudopilin GspI [Pectobacterium]|nr:type II secretion system minor pseudopilin GspI [Pectobacterium carotovorum]KAA3666303.1 type II secretion system protein GspI [Pectobacterium carotovorum subsp. carotovorum]KFX00757.1 general secretion pathway protein GspI [Pectobacterium carotovorum subsp. carotovorum]KHT22148.1 general secretion pathway protein GspI [Pectobacterium carotovorum subsp. carotovorum]KHT26040.1 general secretion pathway protein GspI [Pectobacterium carotovorum subsp. carotovorum]KHT34657.1 general secretion p